MRVTLACCVCGADFDVIRSQVRRRRCCSLECARAWKSQTARGRRAAEVVRHTAGYLLEWAPDHPRQHRGRVLQHVLVMEAMLGRALVGDEVVHHRNGRRDDNRPDNLELMANQTHARHHARTPEGRALIDRRNARLALVMEHDPDNGQFLPIERVAV